MPPDDQVSSFWAPPLPVDYQLWQPPSANPSHLPSSILFDASAAHPELPEVNLADPRAKSTPPCEPRHARPVYPSPPLTDAALASTVPLPDVTTDASSIRRYLPSGEETAVDENMSHDVSCHLAPLSPPPTVLIAPKELPRGHQSQCEGHSVETWRYDHGMIEEDMSTPQFPPVRDDSGYEEFMPSRGHDESRRDDGSVTPLEPMSLWISQSPLSMDEGLPLDGLLPFHDLLSSDRDHVNIDTLLSPASSSDADARTEGWTMQSEMDWSPSPTFVETLSPPCSPKPHGLSPLPYDLDPLLDLQSHNPNLYPHMHSTPLAEDHDPFFTHGSSIAFPADHDSECSDTVMPSDDDSGSLPPSSPHRRPLNDLYDATPPFRDVCLTPVPRSPHRSPQSLPDFDEPPGSPHSPHHSLPDIQGMFEEPPQPMLDTISPSLLGGAPDLEDSLRLDLRPLSDPPYMRSPSPDEDDLGFLDVQFDPESSSIETDEFLQLRALRRSALTQERAARATENELGERISTLANSLLPSITMLSPNAMQTDSEPPVNARARRCELQALMDMRAEARRARKAQKHRSKEIAALLDLKMHSPVLPIAGLPPVGGKGWTRSIAHLVAHMISRRRECARPLDNRPAPLDGRRPAMRRRSSLSMVVSAADVLVSSNDEGREGNGIGDDGMEI